MGVIECRHPNYMHQVSNQMLHSRTASGVGVIGCGHGLGGMQVWVVCRPGWCAGLGGMQAWVVCRSGWCVGLGGVQAWVVCRPGWCASLGGVQAWVVCKPASL